MNIIFKFIYDRLTDPLGLPIDALYEYIILAVIGAVAYGLAYRKIGDMYHRRMIVGKIKGSFFHWVIRVFFFVMLWLVTYGAIQCYYFIISNWQIILIIAGFAAGAVLICTLAVATIRLVKKHRMVNGDA